jgi:hypothetical protein
MPKGPSQSSVQQLKRLIEKYNEAVLELRRQAEEHATHEANARNEENLRELNEKTNRDNEEHFRKLILELEPSPEEKDESLEVEKTPHPEPTHQKNDGHLHQLLHELRAELIHLEAIHHQLNESEPEKHAEKSHFFEHHAETLAHAHQHWFHARHYLELLFEFELEEEFEELLTLQHHMKHLVEDIEREQNELSQALNHTPLHPHPEPPHPAEEDEDK